MTILLTVIISLLAVTAYSDFNSDCLYENNVYREAVGVPDLVWSDDLTASAQNWANTLAATGQYAHSGTPGVGENLAMGTQGAYTAPQYIDLWGAEQANFIPGGVFPDVSATGNWADVGHYTQTVWRDTTQVGCGMASGFGSDFLVCQYTTSGNVEGETVY